MVSSLSGRLVMTWLRERYGRVQVMVLCCLGLTMVGAASLMRLGVGSTTTEIVAATLLMGAGLGGGTTLLFGGALSSFTPRQFGQATGLLFFVRTLGSTIVLGVLSGLLTSRYMTVLSSSLPAADKWLLHSRYAARLVNPRLLLLQPTGLSAVRHPLLFAMRGALASSLHDLFAVILAMTALAFALIAVVPLRLSLAARLEAEGMAQGGGVAMAGDVGLWSAAPTANVPAPAQANALWDIMSPILYWRHGVIQFGAPGTSPALRSFNRFEDVVVLPGSLGDPALSAAFERAWILSRARTPLDRYRAESVVNLLWQTRHLEGDVAVCGGIGDGLALLLALIVRDFGLVKKVYFYTQGTAAPPPLIDSPTQEQKGGDNAALSDLLERHDVRDVLRAEVGPLRESLARVAPQRRFSLVHIDSEYYIGAKMFLDGLLPKATPNAAVIIGHYHDARQRVALAVWEHLRGRRASLHIGPLPQAFFFAGDALERADEAVTVSVEWGRLRDNSAYKAFLSWISDEVAACYAGANSSVRDRHIVAAFDKLALTEPADAALRRFIDTLYLAT